MLFKRLPSGLVVPEKKEMPFSLPSEFAGIIETDDEGTPSFEYKDLDVEIKADDIDQEGGIIKGYLAAFNNKDHGGDIIHPGAFTDSIAAWAKKKLKIRYLWQHIYSEVIGKFLELEEVKRGLRFVAKFTSGVRRADEALLLAIDEAIDTFSIGYSLLKGGFEWDEKTETRHLRKLLLWEGSMVSFPMNDKAVMTDVAVKDIFAAHDPRSLERALMREAGLGKDLATYLAAGFNFSKGQRDASGSEDLHQAYLAGLAGYKNL